MMSRYAFLNVGRASDAGQVIEALDKVERPYRYICLNEVGEGDVGYDDTRLVRQALADTHQLTHAETREPIAVPRDREVLSTWRHYRGLFGVERQSPARSINETIVTGRDGPDEVIVTGHYYAGAKQGDRPWPVRVVLVGLYHLMLRKHRRIIDRHHRRGHHISWWMDTNWADFPQLHDAEVNVFSAAPDFGRVIPASGYDATVTETSEIDQPVEAHHDVHYATVEFVAEMADASRS